MFETVYACLTLNVLICPIIIPMIGNMTMHTEKHSCNIHLIISKVVLVYPTYSPFAGLRQCLTVHKTNNADLGDVRYTIKKVLNTHNNDQL